MLDDHFSIHEDFPTASYEQWRALVEKDLRGAPFEKKLVTHTYEGIDIQPVYSRQDRPDASDEHGFPGLPPFVRGATPLGGVIKGWDLRQEHAHPDLGVSNRAVLDDVQGGVTSLVLRLDEASRRGLDADHPAAESLAARDGLTVYCLDDLDTLLAEVPLEDVAITLDAGAAFLPAAALLAAIWRRRGIPPEEARGGFNADPLAVLSAEGQLPAEVPTMMAAMARLARWSAEIHPCATAVSVNTSAYHNAGATAAQDVAFAMATAAQYLRTMTQAGMDVDSAARQILFRINVGTHHFLAIAKLRAARGLWSRMVEVCGGGPAAGAMRIHARTGQRVLTRRDPYVNLLRNCAAVFAAGVGGADAITSVPFDAMAGLPDDFSRRVARNTLWILQEEAHLSRVVDPAGGSWFLEALTDEVANKAWAILQQIERQGDMAQAIQSGWVAAQIDAAFAPRAKDIARRKAGITGVSEFPDATEQPVDSTAPAEDVLRRATADRVASLRRNTDALKMVSASDDVTSAAVDAATQGASIGQLAQALGWQTSAVQTVAPLPIRTFSEPFEQLRDAADAWRAEHGARPRVFLAKMGPVSHHTARASYAKNFFEAGGFEVIAPEGPQEADAAAAELAASRSNIAVLCSSDQLYPEIVKIAAPKLKAAGARTVILAGNPGSNEDTYRDAGVDRFIYIGCDVLATLRGLLRDEGVLAP